MDWRFFAPEQTRFVEQNISALLAKSEGPLLKQNAVAQLIQYLREPSDDVWKQVAAFVSLATLRPPRPPLEELNPAIQNARFLQIRKRSRFINASC